MSESVGCAELGSDFFLTIQAKPGVKTTNRMDELGEIAASIVKNILGKNGTDTKALSTESKLISVIGTAILKTLSKTPLSDKRDLKADQTEARDIAGSIAQTIFAASTTDVPATQKKYTTRRSERFYTHRELSKKPS